MSWRKGKRPNQRRWLKVRARVLDRDGWKCQHCGKHGRMECDHRIPLDIAPDRMYDETNLQSLCSDCHFLKSQDERRGKPTPPEVLAWRQYLTNSLLSCMVTMSALWAC